nr:hypothetical protein [Roseibium sp. RKSG952]
MVVTVLVTLILVVASYYVWTEANDLARRFAGGTIWTDLRFLVGLLAVYVFLSLADRAFNLLKK